MSGDLALAVVRLARRLRQRHQPASVSLTQLSAMTTLYHEGPMTPGELAAAERVTAPSMTRVLKVLVAAEILTQEPHSTDRRIAVVQLTPHGEDIITGVASARQLWLTRQLAGLDADQRAVLRRAVRLLETVLSGAEPPVPAWRRHLHQPG